MTLEAEPVSPGEALSGKLSGKLAAGKRRGLSGKFVVPKTYLAAL